MHHKSSAYGLTRLGGEAVTCLSSLSLEDTLLTVFAFFALVLKTDSLVLENNGQFIKLEPARAGLYQDQTLVLAGRYRVHHFDLENGSLIRQFGRRGQGPNEYGRIRSVVWTGSHYIVVDSRRLTTTVIDGQGQYVKRYGQFFKCLYRSGGRLWAVNGEPKRQLQRERPLEVFELQLADGDLETIGSRFHRLSEAAVDYFYNYTYHFVAAADDRVFVADQIVPSIYVYDLETKELLDVMRLSLPGFRTGEGQLPSKFMGASPGGYSRREFFRWENGWSRMTALHASGNAILIAYTLPCSCDKPKKRIVKISPRDGTLHDTYDLTSGLLLGALDGEMIILNDWDDGTHEQPTYILEKVTF